MKPRDALTDLAQRLIQRAAHQAPAVLAARLEEEWLADLESRSGSPARLRFAIGCCWATGVITRDLRVPQLAASTTSGANKSLLVDLRADLPLLSRRTVVFILIAAVHVLVIYAFTTGLAQHVVASFPDLTHAVFLDQTQSVRPPPPPIEFKPSIVKTVDIDAAVPRIDYPIQDGSIAPVSTPGSAIQPPTPVARKVTRLGGGPGIGFPTTDEYYPPTSRRLEETGAVIVGVCVDPRGRLSSDPTLVATSGSRRLDDGALNLAKAGSGHYRPTTEDGQPVSACYSYRIRFELD